jgi:hypothetical protein
LLAFYDSPAEHRVHLRTTNPTESTFATVRHRTKITRGPGSRAAGLAMRYHRRADRRRHGYCHRRKAPLLNRGGDRALNRAIPAIAVTRMRSCPRPRAYVARRTAEGKTRREIRHCLKRYIARELYRHLTQSMKPFTSP